MAIRIRKVDGMMIALCAAETDVEPDDIYLNDSIHYALTTKFSEDYNLRISDPVIVKCMNSQKIRDAKETIEQIISEWEK